MTWCVELPANSRECSACDGSWWRPQRAAMLNCAGTCEFVYDLSQYVLELARSDTA